jgi:hypothetical protein
MQLRLPRTLHPAPKAGVTIAIARGDLACPAKALRNGWMPPVSKPADLPTDQQSRHGGLGAPDRSIRGQYRQALRGTGRLRCQHLLRSLSPVRLPDIGSGQGRVNLRNDGRFAAQVSGYPAGICPRCRVVQGSCRGRAALRHLEHGKRLDYLFTSTV